MRKIDMLKEELQQAIRESDEYKEYKRLEEQIKHNPDIKRTVDELRRNNFELQYNSEDSSEYLRLSEELNKKYEYVRYQECASRFLNAETCLCRLVRDICFSVADAIDFDMDFLK